MYIQINVFYLNPKLISIKSKVISVISGDFGDFGQSSYPKLRTGSWEIVYLIYNILMWII